MSQLDQQFFLDKKYLLAYPQLHRVDPGGDFRVQPACDTDSLILFPPSDGDVVQFPISSPRQN